jgi:hypothetical protein
MTTLVLVTNEYLCGGHGTKLFHMYCVLKRFWTHWSCQIPTFFTPFILSFSASTHIPLHPHPCMFIVVYYESIKRKLKTRYICGCRCYERLQSNTKEFTRLAYTELVLELEHLEIETRLMTCSFAEQHLIFFSKCFMACPQCSWLQKGGIEPSTSLIVEKSVMHGLCSLNLQWVLQWHTRGDG